MYGDKGIWYIEIRRDLSIMTLRLLRNAQHTTPSPSLFNSRNSIIVLNFDQYYNDMTFC